PGKTIRSAYVGANIQNVLQQTNAPSGAEDYTPPPKGYMLVNLDAGLSLPLAGKTVDFELGGNNILNEVYREYTDRFRYYADEMGWNVFLRMKMPFELGFAKATV